MTSMSKLKNKSCFVTFQKWTSEWFSIAGDIYIYLYIYMHKCPIVSKIFSNLAFLFEKSPAALSHNPPLKDKT